MNPEGASREFIDRECRLARMPGVEAVDELLRELEEGARVTVGAAELRHERGMDVLAEVDAVRLHARIELLERGDLLLHPVPAVVDHDVDMRHPGAQLRQEAAVRLAADENRGGLVLEGTALRKHIDTHHAGSGPEVVVPHLQRAAVEHSDLEYYRR